MAQDQIEEIKRKIDIAEFIGEYVPLKKAGRNLKGLCPFHTEKTPSFMVSPELQIFKCFGCGLGGDCYKFLMEYEKIDFPQALKVLADRVGVKLQPLRGFTEHQEKEEIYRINHQSTEFYHYLLLKHPIGQPARSYLSKRGTKDDSIETFKLGYAPDRPDALFKFLTQKRGYTPDLLQKSGLAIKKQNIYFDRFRARIMFPLFDHFGNIPGFAGRVIKNEGDIAKYINSPETLVYKKGQTLYGLNIAKQYIKTSNSAVIVEGEFDLISSWQAGVKNIVAIKGSALTAEQSDLISRFCSKIFLALDSDFAGDQASRRGIDTAQKRGLEVKVVSLKPFKDPDEFSQKDPNNWTEAIASAQGIYDFLINSNLEKLDITTTEGKAKASRAISSLLGQIEDEIVKAHLIKQVATRLGVPEESVQKEAIKHTQTPIKAEDEKSPQPKPRRTIVEERLLSLILQTKPILVKDLSLSTLVKTPNYQRLTEQLKDHLDQYPKFNLSSFVQKLPPELKDLFTNAYLLASFAQSEEEKSEEIKSLTKELKVITQKEVISQITTQIKQLEETGNNEKVQELELLLTKSTRQLSELQATL